MMPASLSAWAGRLIETSWQAALLICAILVIRALAGRSISAQWRHALWILVLLRLLLPWTPQSRYSFYGLVPSPLPKSLTGATVLVPGATQQRVEASRPGELGPTAGEVAGAIWFVGAVSFLSWLLVQAAGTILALRGRRPVTEKAILDLLEDCKEEMGIRAYLAVVETPYVRAPALFGWIRPRLLLPEGVVATLGQERMRHVFLHELAHLKRHDIAFNWLAALAQALHWFNPLVWLAFQQARADMEVACDELALARLDDRESSDYGHTILELVATWAEPERVPALASIGEDAAGIKRRIQMIAAFKKGQSRSRLLSAAVVLLVGVVFLVDAQQGKPSAGRQAQLGIPIAAGVHSNATEEKTPPIDAAIKSAEAWLALVDAAEWGQAWTGAHSVVRGMISKDAFTRLCAELRRLDSSARGAVLSRRPGSIEILPNLPMGLGDGISVLFLSRYEKGEYPGPKLLMAKDKDGAWRIVRSDRE